jgi:chromosome segregation ATPase
MSSSVTHLDRWKPSRRLQAAATAERERVEVELARLDTEHAHLTAKLQTLQQTRQELREELANLNRLAHGNARPPAEGMSASATDENAGQGGPPPTTSSDHAVLKGARIREVAVQVLASSPRAYEPIHYRDWYRLFQDAGFVPAGKDPRATFLTQIGRSPAVTRTSEAGVYQLDHDFPDRASERLRALRAQLRELHDPPRDAGLDGIAQAREQRSALSAAVDELERQLEEALRALTQPREPELRAAAG